MKYFSMFSGIGGFELGIQQATPHYQCVGYSEINQYAIHIYSKHFWEHKNYGDATKIRTKDLPNFDLLVGGFPCQAFSIAGKRKGFNDTRGTMFFEIAKIVREKQPRFLLLENVKGLLSHAKGDTFLTILSALDELGYDCQWQVLNSKNFGVPQNRERVFIIGHLRGTSRPEVFPIGCEFKTDNRELAKTVLARGYKGIGNQEMSIIRTNKSSSRSKRDKPDSSNRIRRASYSNDMRVRRLTPTECERLQGFPDGWTEGLSDTQRYKCLGNAVTVNVIKVIFDKWKGGT
jgi:DNA (cytosine-5)-methyltransferase 1